MDREKHFEADVEVHKTMIYDVHQAVNSGYMCFDADYKRSVYSAEMKWLHYFWAFNQSTL